MVKPNNCRDRRAALLSLLLISGYVSQLHAQSSVTPFLKQHCYGCHSGKDAEAGLDLTQVGLKLNDADVFGRWVLIHDRVRNGEMPPKSSPPPNQDSRREFVKKVGQGLTLAHANRKGTVLRRLNRKEYENTLNDLFGVNLKLAEMLPEDGKSQEFDNVGNALGVSMVHLQRYMDAAKVVLDSAIATSSAPTPPKTISASYAETREAEKFVGRKWMKLSDGAVVRFSRGGYPSGMIRGTNVRERGRYRVRVSGYAFQSDKPITFSVGGTSFARGSTRPIYGFWSFPPGKPGSKNSIEFEALIERNYMIIVEPYGIADPKRYQRKTIEGYKGPGLAITNVTLEGPLVDEWPSRGHQLLFKDIQRTEIEPPNPRTKKRRGYVPRFKITSDDEKADSGRILTRLAENAFRRSVKPSEVLPFVELFKSERRQGSTFEESLRTSATAILCSPKFLYFNEPDGKLDDYALANRLSYFLIRSAPDKQLLNEARNGRLTSNPRRLLEQVDRLIKSDKFERFLEDFTDSWLDLRDLDFTVPDRKLYPEFDDYLRYSMPLETRAFLHELINSNLSISNIVESDFAMLNDRLADHYDLPPVIGAKLQRVKLPANSVRGGFLSQASVLKVTANGTNTSPVKRGAWFSERILGVAPPPPPPGIPGVEPDIRGAATLRELLAKHRNVPSCNGCHRKIDPPGFALESFNAIGGFREYYRSMGEGKKLNIEINGRRVGYREGPPVDSSGRLDNGRSFDGFNQFRKQLANDHNRLAKAFVIKLLTFATGRELGFSDRVEIDRIVEASSKKNSHKGADENYGVRDLFHLVIQSSIFRSK